MDEACERALKLTGLKDKGYKALLFKGGASLQFLMAAYNLLEKKAGYLNTGTWSDKAIKEAKLFGEVIEVSSSKDKITITYQKIIQFHLTWIIFTSLLTILFSELNTNPFLKPTHHWLPI